VSTECPVCHRAWSEHRQGYSASHCKNRPPKHVSVLGISEYNAHAFTLLQDAMEEGRIAIIVENHPEHRSGLIYTDMQDLIEFLEANTP
jgi:hypothetical protein